MFDSLACHPIPVKLPALLADDP